ncbi:ribonuclease H-like domain-containing protein [Tanacetum coccineum]
MVGPSPSNSSVVDSINNLDVGNPLHVHNSDNSNSVIIPFKLLGTENYKIWSGAVKLALQARNKYGFVDRSCLKESYATSDVLSAQWDRCNAMVLTWIMNVVSQDVYMGLVYSENAAVINSVKQGGSSVADYYHRLNSLWMEFDALTKLPKCTCEVKCSCDASKELGLHKQLMKLMQFLMGLDDCYQPVRSSLLISDPLPEVKDAYNVVSREESHRGVPESSGGTESKQNATSFAAKTFNNNKKQYNNNSNNFTRGTSSNVNRGPNPNLNCKHCGKIGHTIDSDKPSSSSLSSGFTSEQIQKLLNLINDKSTGSIHANIASRDSFFNGNVWFNINFSRYFFSNSSLSMTTITLGWIIDSGANQHLTGSISGMVNVVDISDLKITIGHPNGTLVVISHVGNLKLANNVMLYDVLVVPGYCVSLLSVNKLIRDSKMFVGFDENKCYIQDLKRERILGTGSKSGGLYLFDVIKFVSLNYIKSNKNVIGLINPNDDGRDTSNVECSLPHSDMHDSTQGRNQSDRLTATQIDDQNWSEGNVQNISQSSPTQNRDDVQTTIIRRSERQSKPPVRFNDYILSSNVKYGIEKYVSYSRLCSVNMCFAVSLNKSIEPTCLAEALSDPNWVEAMNNEIEALNKNNTWAVCDLPVGIKPIGSKWIWKIKYKASGDIEIYKARLVAKGFSKKEGFDYDKTFSPVVKMVSVRCLISIAVVNKWPLYHLDVNNAFLYSDLVEDVYMTLPDGYNSVDKSKVCKLNKSLYGLKQAPRSGMFIALLMYGDDIVITGSDIDGINEFKLFLSTKFLIKDLGALKYFLGIEVIENDLGLCTTQRKQCMELLHEYGLLAARPIDIPLPENTILSCDETENDKYLSDFTTYQKLVGKLIYLTNTRPDISYAFHCLSQHMHSPLQSHSKAALRVLRYLKGSPGYWAKCPKTRKFVTGLCVFLGKTLVSWKSKKQATISKSSLDPEYRSMSSASREVVLLGNMLHSIGLKGLYPVELCCDNSSAIEIAANPIFHERTKHFELDAYFVREKVLAGVIKTVKVSSNLQNADVFTKCLGVVQHKLCCRSLGLLDIFAGELVGKVSERQAQAPKEKVMKDTNSSTERGC